MNGSRANVFLEGFDRPVGNLTKDERGNVQFAYARTYLDRSDSVALSLSLPLRDEPFGDQATQAFFLRLLPGSHVDARSCGAWFDALVALRDGPGAIVCRRDDHQQGDQGVHDCGGHRLLTHELAIELFERSAFAPEQAAVAQLPDGRIVVPEAGSEALTSHWLVGGGDRPLRSAPVISASLDLAVRFGLPAADARVVSFERTQPSDTLLFERFDMLLVARSDRKICSDGKVIRVHQESFAQAAGIPPPTQSGDHAASLEAVGVAAILARLDNPVGGRIRFIEETLFDLAIGDFETGLSGWRLQRFGSAAPLLAPKQPPRPSHWDSGIDQLACPIGSARRARRLTAAAFDEFLTALQIPNAAARRRIRETYLRRVVDTLSAALPELRRRGLRSFADTIQFNTTLLDKALGSNGASSGRNVADSARLQDLFSLD